MKNLLPYLERRYMTKNFEGPGVIITVPKIEDNGKGYILYFRVEYKDLNDNDAKLNWVIKTMQEIETEAKKYYHTTISVYFESPYGSWIIAAEEQLKQKKEKNGTIKSKSA
jgi:hypothetical protein